MRTDLARQFNQEVDNYRKSLLYYARACEWSTFEAKAGKLFDYLESIEFQEIERKFFTIFYALLAALIVAVIGLVTVDFGADQELLRMKNPFIMSALAMSTFEVYFFLDYRIYAYEKSSGYKRRKARFIRGIEQDFRNLAANADQMKKAA